MTVFSRRLTKLAVALSLGFALAGCQLLPTTLTGADSSDAVTETIEPVVPETSATAPAAERGPEETWALFAGSVERNRADVLTDLLNEGVTPNLFVNQGDPALVRAIRLENWDVVQVLMQSEHTDMSMRSEIGEDALMLAAFKGNVPLVTDILNRGAAINPGQGWTALHYAATNGHAAVAQLLIDKGADVNARTASGITPLYMAARKPSREVVVMLLRAGAFRDLCNDRQQSPADAARTAGDTELADYLAIKACVNPATLPQTKTAQP